MNKLICLSLLLSLVSCGPVSRRWEHRTRKGYRGRLQVKRPRPKRFRKEVVRKSARYLIGRSSRMIVAGMSKRDVIRAWGYPKRRDIAGYERYENERWLYSTGGRIKLVYFESGVVQGWNLGEE